MVEMNSANIGMSLNMLLRNTRRNHKKIYTHVFVNSMRLYIGISRCSQGNLAAWI